MKFKDVTEENINVTIVLKQNYVGTSFVKVYDREDTRIIYSGDGSAEHASISNPTRKIRDAEIKYAIHRIMKSKLNDVKVFLSSNGIIHINKGSLIKH